MLYYLTRGLHSKDIPQVTKRITSKYRGREDQKTTGNKQEGGNETNVINKTQ